MENKFLRIHQFLPGSYANGPGYRAVLWIQGCSLGCAGCFNPKTHSFSEGRLVLVEDIFQQIMAQPKIEGVTISGGEPLQQAQSLLVLLKYIRQHTSLSVLLFSGFTWQEIQKIPYHNVLLAGVDVLIAGRYDATRHLGYNLRGSANQTIHLLTNRYTEAEVEASPPTEIVITTEGEMIVSGIAPPVWEKKKRTI